MIVIFCNTGLLLDYSRCQQFFGFYLSGSSFRYM